jgi:hypothetical protein
VLSRSLAIPATFSESLPQTTAATNNNPQSLSIVLNQFKKEDYAAWQNNL